MYRPNIIIHEVSHTTIVASKNGITLKKIEVSTKTTFELYMDEDILNRFYNEKEAMRMFKDFSC